MPAAAVIPAPIAYIKVVAVKKLVVGFQSIEGFSGLPPYFFWGVCTGLSALFFWGVGRSRSAGVSGVGNPNVGVQQGSAGDVGGGVLSVGVKPHATRAFLSLLLPAVLALGVLRRLSRLLFRLIKSRLDVRSHSLLSVGILSSQSFLARLGSRGVRALFGLGRGIRLRGGFVGGGEELKGSEDVFHPSLSLCSSFSSESGVVFPPLLSSIEL